MACSPSRQHRFGIAEAECVKESGGGVLSNVASESAAAVSCSTITLRGRRKLIEGVVGRTAQGVRMARLRAGWPVALWPLVMSVFLFNLAWFAAGGTEYETTIRGQWLPVPVGARVLYLPTNNSDVRMKKDR